MSRSALLQLVVSWFVLGLACAGSPPGPTEPERSLAETTPVADPAAPEPATPAPAVFLDVRALTGQSKAGVAKILGEPTLCETVKPSGVGSVPRCEYRYGNVEVVYIGGKADWITVAGRSQPAKGQDTLIADFAPDSLRLLNLTGEPTGTTASAIGWKGSVPGIREVLMFRHESGRVDYVYIKVKTP